MIRTLVSVTHLKQVAALFALAFIMIQSAAAATQGKWGRTSTATAKITLIIPPRGYEQVRHSFGHSTGFQALQDMCDQIQQGRSPSSTIMPLFEFSLSNTVVSDLATSLIHHCSGQVQTAKLSGQSDIATILISPL